MLFSETQKKLALTISVIPCPNCGGKFYPKADTGNFTNIRCGECYYEAWFHSVGHKKQQIAFSVDTQDLERILAQKLTLPPFILYWTWHDQKLNLRWEVAQLYPFVPYSFLRAADSYMPIGGQENAFMVFLQADEDLLNSRLYTSPDDDELAEVVHKWEDLSTEAIQREFDMGFWQAANILKLAEKIRAKRGLPTPEDSEE